SQQGTVANPLDPMLAPLANNGGPTVGAPGLTQTLTTLALLPGSPALDAAGGGGPNTDERGFPRPHAGPSTLPDVGAFEFQDLTLAVAITAPPTPTPLGGTGTFTIQVTNTSSKALPADNTTVRVTLPPGLSPAGPQTFTVGPLAAGQSVSFAATAAGV